jgi:formate hydrogenlyase subunit 3/multisubunit Na+/H+ antiporter MnhD subunit
VKSILALAAAVAMSLILVAVYRRKRSTSSALLLLAALCLVLVSLTHVFEAYRFLPSFGWGRPNSVGHYLDLFSALLSVVFILLAAIVGFANRRPRSHY